MECLLPYLCMVTVPNIMVGLERMSDCRGVGLVRFHCTYNRPSPCLLACSVVLCRTVTRHTDIQWNLSIAGTLLPAILSAVDILSILQTRIMLIKSVFPT